MEEGPVAGAGHADGGVLCCGEELGAVGEAEAGYVACVMQQSAELAVLVVFEDGAGGERGEELGVWVGDGAGGGGVGGEVVDIDALVC